MPAKILALENDAMKADAPELDTENMLFGREWNPATESPPEDIAGPCQCPFFRNDSASKAGCSYRHGRLEMNGLSGFRSNGLDVIQRACQSY